MTDERYDYYQSQQQKAKVAHRTPISPPRTPSEAENHAKDGQCKTIVLPNLPSVAERVKYAMGTMDTWKFSKRCGISDLDLFRICNGSVKSISAYNANRIAAASERGVTIGWLLGLKQYDLKEIENTPGFIIANFVQQSLPIEEHEAIKNILGYSWKNMSQWLSGKNLPSKEQVIEIAKKYDACKKWGNPRAVEYLEMAGITEDALPELDNLVDRLEYARKKCGKKASEINKEIGASHSYYSIVIREKTNVGDKYKEPLAKALNVDCEWLFKGCPSDEEIAKRKGYKAGAAIKNKKIVGDKATNRGSEHKKMENQKEKFSSGTHLHFEGVYSGDVLSALVSVLKGTYRVNLTIDEVGAET